MTIQNDIFDVARALEYDTEADCFDRICVHISNLEKEIEFYQKFYKSTLEAKKSVDKIESVFNEI